jgi:hypothetical protein
MCLQQKDGVSGYTICKPRGKQTIYIEIKNNKSEDIPVNLRPTMRIITTGIFYDVDVESPETSIR